jgi:oligopeptide transport system permease protein
MLAYTLRRVLIMIPVLWAVATITFILMHAVPGGPLTQEKTRPPALQAALERRYGLDEPLWKQYTTFLWNTAQGDLGISFKGDRDVTEIIKDTFFVTAQVGLLAFLLAVVVGMTLGTISALNHNGPGDYAGVFFATVGASVPSFIIGAFLSVAVITMDLSWFKLSGWGGPLEPSDTFKFSEYEFGKMVIPVVALGMLSSSFIARVTRASVLEVLNQDYIRTARAKGLREQTVVLRHAIKNAMIPVLTLMGPTFAVLVTGSFIIETMFSIPGLGRESIQAISRRDYGMIMGTTIFFAFIVTVANLAVDLAYAAVDPRIRYR